MAADWTIKAGDQNPIFTDTLTLKDGSVPPLAGAKLAFVLRSLTASAPVKVTGTATITDLLSGAVQFAPTSSDTATPGLYQANWIVTYAQGSQQTFPTVGYLTVSIEENLVTGAQQLVSLPDVKDYLSSYGLPAQDRVHDQKLTRLINSATPIIENAVGPVIVRQFEEWHDGGQTYIMLRRRPSSAIGCTPVITLIACSEYNGPIEWALANIASPDEGQMYSYMVDVRLGRVVRRTAGGGVQGFPYMPQAVHVIYMAGQASVPENVRMVALEAIRHNYATTQPTGRGMETVADEDGRGHMLPFFLPPVCLEMLAPMRRHPALA
jgi:hypothetical protein